MKKNTRETLRTDVAENRTPTSGLDELIEEFENNFLNEITEMLKNYGLLSDIEEVCPHCDHINQVSWDGKSRTIICENCGKEMLLCSLCDMDKCDCNNCPYKLNKEETL